MIDGCSIFNPTFIFEDSHVVRAHISPSHQFVINGGASFCGMSASQLYPLCEALLQSHCNNK